MASSATYFCGSSPASRISPPRSAVSGTSPVGIRKRPASASENIASANLLSWPGRPHRCARDQQRRRDLEVAASGARDRGRTPRARAISRAPSPVRMAKRLPESFAARAKSRMPSCFAELPVRPDRKVEGRGSPQRRTSTLALSSMPSGTESSSRLGVLSSSARSGELSSVTASAPARASASAISDERASIFGRSSRAAAALSDALPISAERRFFSALARSATVSAERYSSS